MAHPFPRTNSGNRSYPVASASFQRRTLSLFGDVPPHGIYPSCGFPLHWWVFLRTSSLPIGNGFLHVSFPIFLITQLLLLLLHSEKAQALKMQ
jgi:hypothetical protein